jgi:hypothetical protein
MALPYGRSAFPTEGDANGSGVASLPGSGSASEGRPLWKALQMGGRSGPASVRSACVAASAIPTAVTTALAAESGKIVSQYTSIFTIVKKNVCRFCREESIDAEAILIHAVMRAWVRAIFAT